MSEMLERVALAIYRQAWGAAADKRWHDDEKGRAHFMKQARAAVLALRDDPGMRMVSAMSGEVRPTKGGGGVSFPASCWTAPIDAILDESPKSADCGDP